MSNHSFDILIAEEYKSVEIAILVWHFQYWIIKNKRLGKNQIEGRTWTYQTIEEIAAVFPYWSIDQVRRLLKKSIDLNILIRRNFNKSRMDKTAWYSFENEEKFTIRRFRHIDAAISPDASGDFAGCIYKDIYTLTNTITDKREEALPPASSFSSGKKEQKEQNVFLTDEEHHKLVSKYGEEKTKSFYKILSDWKLDTPKAKWKKDDYRSILRWVINAESEKKAKTVSITDNASIKRNKEICEIAEEMIRPFNTGRVFFTANPEKAQLVHMEKDIRKEYPYDGFTPDNLKETLKRDLINAFPRAKEVFEKKT